MENNFTVIIPARNAWKTLGVCLDAVLRSSSRPYEVIVVDDGSTDGTAAVASAYPCRVLSMNLGEGPMQPRFYGAREAKSEICIFVDSDVRVKADTFSKILKHFENSGISAVTGILEANGGCGGFFSAYKNEYMNYIFKKQPAQSHFLYGSLWAIRKKDLIYFEPVSAPFGSLVSDTEMGMRLAAQGKNIFLDYDLEIEHFKRYDFFKLLRNDFVIPFMFAQIFFVYAKSSQIASKKSFSHARAGQVFVSLLALLGFFSFLMGWIAVSLALFLMVEIYWGAFLKILTKNRGFLFACKAAVFIPLDAAVMFLGMVAGFVFVVIAKSEIASVATLPRNDGAVIARRPKADEAISLSQSLVSVIMLSYNYEKYLDQAIQSVLNQTYSNFELIIMDDGSRDHSLEILERYQKTYPEKIKIFTHPGKTNQGIVKSYELAFSKVSGEFIAFLEADDFWYPENLEKKIRAFQQNSEVGVVFSSYRPFGNFLASLYWKFYRFAIAQTIPSNRPVDLFGQFLRRNPVASFTHFVMRKSLLARIVAPARQLKNYDWWVLGHLSVSTLFYFIPEKLTAWRIHSKSSGYGRVGTLALVRLHSFLMKYYESLLEMIASTSLLQRKSQLERSYALLRAIKERKWAFLCGRIICHPLTALRFLGFFILRNLMFLKEREA
ncbi:MAG: glycosyltransferase [Candidatus Omnitrophica bacterium]|nr:glycosyltransferase [Candidatus Omnitrophota bacterium]